MLPIKDPADIRATLARSAARRAARALRVQENAALSGNAGNPGKKKGKKVPARKAAFLRLKRLCKEFVMARAAAKGGFCEVAMSCGGEAVANTWYHAWPQKGGNGLRYDVRSHFASCGACNMGEYGARMAGRDAYINRHKEILGLPLWQELDALKGRRQIGTIEAREMGDALEAMLGRLG